jgi:hypothetical protein
MPRITHSAANRRACVPRRCSQLHDVVVQDAKLGGAFVEGAAELGRVWVATVYIVDDDVWPGPIDRRSRRATVAEQLLWQFIKEVSRICNSFAPPPPPTTRARWLQGRTERRA